MPKQIWEVADDRKLRRSVGTTQEFNRSGYDTIGLGAPEHYYGSLSLVINGLVGAAVLLPTNEANDMYGTFSVPEHWAKGKLKLHMFYTSSLDNSETPSTVSLRSRTRAAKEGNVTGSLYVDIIAAEIKSLTFDFAEDVMQKTTFESDEVDAHDYDLMSYYVGRNAAPGGSDDMGGDVEVYGVTLEWQPIVATA